MKKKILGISAYYHDSAAALVQGGEIIAAAQEERFSRKRHDPRFPASAINYCLEEGGIEAEELDAIVFYDNPILTWDRVIKNCLHVGKDSFEHFGSAARSVLGTKVWVEENIRENLGTLGKAGKLLCSEHHMAHAASAFFPSPFEAAAILTADGVGEWCTTSVGFGEGTHLELRQEIHYPHSLGLLYSAFTFFTGFKVNSGEYKLMGLAPYGNPKFVNEIRDNLIDIKDDGSFRLNLAYFDYLEKPMMTNDRFAELFGGPAREPESRITRREVDLAASIQAVCDEVVIKLGRFAHKSTGSRHLVMAGGVALNCVANGHLLREGIFDDIWIQPAAGDAGGALGAALMASHAYFGEDRAPLGPGGDRQKGSFLGPEFRSGEIKAFLDRTDCVYEEVKDEKAHADQVADFLAEGKIVGLFTGRMEFGPRALGGRSIIGDPRQAETQSTMNLKIKYRESFRPFAPAVLKGEVSEYFEIDRPSPYMLLVAPVREARRLPSDLSGIDGDGDLLSIVNRARSDLPAITHVDYSARIQTIDEETNPVFHNVVSAFKDRTQIGVVVNTSFNVRGEPIVCTPSDAYACFMRTEMDVLVLGDFILHKEQQPEFEDTKDWRQEYMND